MTPLAHLKDLSLADNRRKFPSPPEYARTCPPDTDRTANGLTRMVIDFIRLNGGQAERIAVTGRYLDQKKVVTDIGGFQRRIGSSKWIPGSLQKGSADISATVNGRSVKLEIKVGKDRLSPAQLAFQQQVERAGSIYLIVRNFDDFYNFFSNTFPDFRAKSLQHEK